MLDNPVNLPTNCRAAIVKHMSSFLHVIYTILNTSVDLERNEVSQEKNHLERNEARGGNLLLSSTVSCL